MKPFKILVGWMWTFLVFSCGGNNVTHPVKETEPAFKKDGVIEIYRNDSLVADFDTEVADTPYQRQTGLMYRKQMNENQSMFFVFPDEKPRYFYMKNTFIPLDIIFIDAENKIVSIAKNARPLDETTLGSGKPARFVLEVKAGTADKLQLQPGDSIVLKK